MVSIVRLFVSLSRKIHSMSLLSQTRPIMHEIFVIRFFFGLLVMSWYVGMNDLVVEDDENESPSILCGRPCLEMML